METLDDKSIAHVASYFQALSEPTRLQLINALRTGELRVGKLAAQFGCTTANVSKHLGLLAKGGFVEHQTRATCAYYRISDPAIFDLCERVCGQLGGRLGGPPGPAVQAAARPTRNAPDGVVADAPGVAATRQRAESGARSSRQARRD